MQRKFIFDGGASTRYHTVEVHNRQSIADHSFGVAWFCELITEGAASKELIMAALAHDLAEHKTGDIPSPVKRRFSTAGANAWDTMEQIQLDNGGVGGYSRTLTDIECNVLKYADMMEGLMFCVRERSLGNKNVDIVFGNFWSYIHLKLADDARNYVERVNLLIEEIHKEWEIAIQ